MPLVKAGIATLALVCGSSCAAATATKPVAPAPEHAVEEAAAALVEAGAPRLCVHDAKDLAPCVEDCDRGVVSACIVVANRTERGDGVGRDLTRAVQLHERACELRDAPSCASAARMYASGRGVPPNRAKQLQLLASACMLGDAHACSLPAKAFASGADDVPRDERRAAQLRHAACVAGDSASCAEVERRPP
jgi:TPR repeat protein